MEPPANPGDGPVELELTVENVESVSDLLSVLSHFTGQDGTFVWTESAEGAPLTSPRTPPQKTHPNACLPEELLHHLSIIDTCFM